MYIAATGFGYPKVSIFWLCTRSVKSNLLQMQLVDKILALQGVLHISVYMCVTFRKAFQIQNDNVQGQNNMIM